jgi:hypothetical protein
MVQFVLTVDTTNQFTSLMKLMADTGIHFKITEPNTKLFAKMLKAAKAEEDLDIFYDTAISTMSDTYITPEHLDTPVPCRSSCSKPVFLQPTQHFKKFCDSTWLNSKGLIHKELALYFVEQQLKMRGIKRDGIIIYTNDYLRDLFQTNAAIIYEKDIPSYVDQLFVAHSKDS